MQVTAKLDTVVINGNDLEPLISFWKALLGVEKHEREGFLWTVFADPGGNEFCLVVE